jgi:hypothetical protein
MRTRRRVVIALALATLAGAMPGSAVACAPYTILGEPDGYGLTLGLRWAGVGVVTDEIENAELPLHPLAMVLAITETLAGDSSIRRLRIDQDSGCDGFWYREGDHVIAAIGSRHEVHEPSDGITNYGVAVWVIRDGRVDGRIAVPMIDGRTPKTEAQLRAWLAGLPDTAMDDPPGGSSNGVFVVALPLAALVGAMIAWRRSRGSLEIPGRGAIADRV